MLKHKSVDVKVDDNGAITAYASTFTREPDWAGDVVAEYAFDKWLDYYGKNGTTMPMLYNHDQQLDSFIGKVAEIGTDDHGLLFTAEFDATDTAQRARELAKDGRLCKLSFAYEVRDQATITLPDGRKANELRELWVSEVSLVLNPCNPDTSVVDVKSGRRNSKADADELRAIRESARTIITAIDGLLADEDTPDEADDTSGGPNPDAKAEEPEGANAEEPTDEEAKRAELLENAQAIIDTL